MTKETLISRIREGRKSDADVIVLQRTLYDFFLIKRGEGCWKKRGR